MSVYISSAQSSTLEPLRKNRWIMQFTRIPGASDKEDSLTFAAHTSTQPQVSFNEIMHHRINEQFYTAGKPTWSEISMSFYDFIRGPDSAGDILYNWANSVYNPITGQMFFKTSYQTSATLAMLGPMGGVSRVWNLFYIWPKEVNWNDLSSEDDGIAEVNVSFRFDYAVKGTDVSAI